MGRHLRRAGPAERRRRPTLIALVVGVLCSLLALPPQGPVSAQGQSAGPQLLAGLTYTAGGQTVAVNPASGSRTVRGPAAPPQSIVAAQGRLIWVESEPQVWPSDFEPAPQVWRIVAGQPDGSQRQVLLESSQFYATFSTSSWAYNTAPFYLTLGADQQQIYFDPCRRTDVYFSCRVFSRSLATGSMAALSFGGWRTQTAPDGQRAFGSYRGYCQTGGSFVHTYLQRQAGGDIELGKGTAGDVAWLSDGRIVFSMVDWWSCAENPVETNRIRVAGPSGAFIADIVTDVIVDELAPSPDETRLAYLLSRLGPQGDLVKELWVVDLSGANPRKLADLPADAADLRWRESGEFLVDSGFRPYPDGYSFANYASNYPSMPGAGDFTQADLIALLGEEGVCVTGSGPGCRIKESARVWLERANQAMAGGHCDGMAVTSLRFFTRQDYPVSLQPTAELLFELRLASSRRHIASYFVRQLLDPVRSHKASIVQQRPAEILGQLRAALEAGDDPPTLIVRQRGEDGSLQGHAITPYAIQQVSADLFRIRVYDNNHPYAAANPAAAERWVEVDTRSDTWSYDMGGATWRGDAETDTFGIVPISLYADPTCPSWCAPPTSPASGAAREVWFSSAGRLLITDAEGRRLGAQGGVEYREIPGATEAILDGGLGKAIAPIYTLPATGALSFQLTDPPAGARGAAQISQFGPGYAITVLNIPQGGPSPLIRLAADGQSASFAGQGSAQPGFRFAVDAAQGTFTLTGVDVGAGKTATVSADPQAGQLILDGSALGGGAYDLRIDATIDGARRLFVHRGVALVAGDTQYLVYGALGVRGAVLLRVDRGSDGSIDRTVQLFNQATRVYLPALYR